jgi:hypothetical protein
MLSGRHGDRNPAITLTPDEWETKVRKLAALFSPGGEATVHPDIAAGLLCHAVSHSRAIHESPLQLPIGELSCVSPLFGPPRQWLADLRVAAGSEALIRR